MRHLKTKADQMVALKWSLIIICHLTLR